MKTNSENLWNQFKTSFKKNIEENNDIKAKLGLLNKTKTRKEFLKDYLFPDMENDLELKFEKEEEFLLVDYTFYREGEKCQWKVPLIFVESECVWSSAEKEVRKLCSVNAPLKILILYRNYSTIEVEQGDWKYIMQDYIQEYQLVGYFALLIYTPSRDSGGKYEFRSYLYNDSGVCVEDDKLLVKIE
ncbi:MAG: hypothetical protein IH948_07290 [Bacteroidetes bacterium]|nr:hypothetical protein [Bacteroidota bacterium]